MPSLARAFVIVLALAAVACGGDSPDRSASTPTTPTPAPAPTPTPTPAPSSTTVSGTLTATNGAQPLGGVQIAATGVAPLTTATDGRFTLSFLATTSAASVELSGPSIVSRRLVLATRTRSVTLDAIALTGGFSLPFYRQLVRNGLEAPNELEPIRRWTENPRVHIRTVFGANRPVDASSLDTVAATITSAVSVWTGGRLSVAAVERGAEPRSTPGWITVTWNESLGDGVCGRAAVGANPGRIELHPRNENCRCGGEPAQVSRSVIVHEVGHAMGFWHTDSRDDALFDTLNSCNSGLSARERLHAPIAYARPEGNIDPDTDPSGVVTSTPFTVVVR